MKTTETSQKATPAKTNVPFFGKEAAQDFFVPGASGPVIQKAAAAPVAAAPAPAPAPVAAPAAAPAPASKAAPSLESRLSSNRGRGESLPEDTMDEMESSLGADLSKVRIHQDPEAVQMSNELSAQAFTHGSDIYFNKGKYDTGSNTGQRLLAHELTHVIQQGGSREMVSRQTEPDIHDTSGKIEVAGNKINHRQYVEKYSTRIAGELGFKLADASFATGVPHVTWLGGSSKQFAIDFWAPVWDKKNSLYDILSEMIAPDFLELPINFGRDAIADEGTDAWMPGVITELNRYVSRRLIMALRRVMPIYVLIMNRHQQQDEEKKMSSDIYPRDYEIIPMHPIERYMLPALKKKLQVDFPEYRKEFTAGLPQIPKNMILRPVQLEFEASKGATNWIKVITPPDVRIEEVANELYGTAEKAWTLSGNAPYFVLPIRGPGREDLYRMKQKYEEIYQKYHPTPPQGSAVTPPDPQHLPEPLTGGTIADEIALSQARAIQPTHGTKTDILQRIQLARKFLSDTINAFEKEPTFRPKVGWLSTAYEAIDSRYYRLASAPEAAVQQWDAQSVGQLWLLRAAYEGITMAVKQKETFKDFPTAGVTIENLAFNYTDVVRYSANYDTGKQALEWADDQSKLFPIVVIEDVLAETRAAIENAKKDKTEVVNAKTREAVYDIKGLEKTEQEIRQKLVLARTMVLQNPEAIKQLVKEIIVKLQDLRIGATIVSNMDAVDRTWKELHEATTVTGEVRSIWGGGNAILRDGQHASNQLWTEWSKIYSEWKFGDKEKAKNDLLAKSKSKEWKEWFKKVADMIHDHQVIDKWMNLAIMVGIAIITGGLGAYVEGYLGAAWGVANLTGRAALTSYRVWAAAGIAATTEAAVFTGLSMVILEKDPSFSGFLKSFGENLVMFGGMKGLSKGYAALLGAEKMATIGGKVGEMATQFAAMNGYSLVKANIEKNQKFGRSLTWDEIMDISFQNLAFTVAMAIGGKLSEPVLRTVVVRGRLQGGYAAVENAQKNLEAISKQVKDAKGADARLNAEFQRRNNEMLQAEKDLMKDLVRIAADPKLAKAAGMDAKAAKDLTDGLAAVQGAIVASHLEAIATNDFLVASAYYDQVREFYRAQKGTKVTERPADPVTHVRTLEIKGPEQTMRITERISVSEKDIIREPDPVSETEGAGGKKEGEGAGGKKEALPDKKLSFDERLEELLRLNPEKERPYYLKSSIDKLRSRGVSEDLILAIVRNGFIHGDMRANYYFGALNTFGGKFGDVLGSAGFHKIVEGLAGSDNFYTSRMLMDQVSKHANQAESVKKILTVFSVGEVGALRTSYQADVDADFVNAVSSLTRIDGTSKDIFTLLTEAGGNQTSLERLTSAIRRLNEVKGKLTMEQVRASLDFGHELRTAFADQKNVERLIKVLFKEKYTGKGEITLKGGKKKDAFLVTDKLTGDPKKPGDKAAEFMAERMSEIASLVLGGDSGTVINEVTWSTIRTIIEATDLPTIVQNGIIGEIWSYTKKQQYRNLNGDANVIKEVHFKWKNPDGSWSKSFAKLDAVVRDPHTGKLHYKEFKSSEDASTSDQQEKVYQLLKEGKLDQLKPFGEQAEKAFGGPDFPDLVQGEVEFERPKDK